MHLHRLAVLSFAAFFLSFSSYSQSTSASTVAQAINEENQKIRQEHYQKQEKWVNTQLQKLSLEERIAQLFMIAAYSNRNETHYKQIEEFVEKYGVGGLIFFQGTPLKQAELTNRYQAKAKVPLLLAMDAEWGLGMRLKNTISYPRQMILGAINDSTALYELGQEVAKQCKRLGVHVNFAPVVDVNSNPKNPVIGTRSFGENKYRVAANGIAYMKGMQDAGIIATAKHFPGHGDTDSDSHYTLPLLSHDKNRLQDLELYPFQRLFTDSVRSVMVAHLNIPAYDSTERPTTLSKNVVTDLLKNDMKFDGLIFTDAMNMKGLSNSYTPDEANVEAILAGNDILLYPASIPKGIALIKKAVLSGKISKEEIDQRVRKVLRAKYFVGLNDYKPIETKGLVEYLNRPAAQSLNEVLHHKAITIVKNKNGLLPFQNLDTLTFGSIVINEKEGNQFQKMLSNYAPFEHVAIPQVSERAFSNALSALRSKKVVVVGVFGVNQYSVSQSFGILPSTQKFIEKLSKQTKVIVVNFGHAYSLQKFENQDYLVAAYLVNKYMQKGVPQVLFGAVSTQARLPVSAGQKLKEGDGFSTQELQRLKYSDVPEGSGMNSESLYQGIDKIAQEAIKLGATPGCQVVIARKGTVIFQKEYGHFTYKKRQEVEPESIYDLASLTKITAAVPALMRLVESGKIDLNAPISTYLPELKNTNKANITTRQVLMHRAGLLPHMPGWFETFHDSLDYITYYKNQCEGDFCLPVAENVYARASVKDSIWNWVISAPMRKVTKQGTYSYRYSDRGFYLLNQLIERVEGATIDYLTDKYLYKPLGLSTATYRPRQKHEVKSIVPSSVDDFFRKRELRGDVHDYSAAILGGVSGHAGVFSNANDVAILMQMYLQNGFYGGKRYFDEQTVSSFTHRQHQDGRRALGFDMSRPNQKTPASIYASKQTYGHRGFTGTAAWVDAKKELVFVFLANRTYPNQKNKLLITKAIRRRMMEVMFQSVSDEKQTSVVF